MPHDPADVLAAAREALAGWMIANGFVTGHGDTLADLLAELQAQVAEMRRQIVEFERR